MDRSSTDYFSFRFDPLVLILVRASSSIFLFPCTTRLSRVRSRDRSGVVVSDACVRFSPPFPLRSSSFYFLRANFDPGLGTTPSLFLLFSFLLPLAPAHCPSASRLHRNTVTYPHGNRYPARGYRTLISSRASRSHIPGFVGTVHRTVSFGYSKRSESGFSRK